MIKIQPIPNQITPHGFLSANKIELISLSVKLGEPMSFYYRVIAEKEIEKQDKMLKETQETNFIDITIMEGNLTMTQEDYDNWDSNDDSYAENWCLKKLNLKRL